MNARGLKVTEWTKSVAQGVLPSFVESIDTVDFIGRSIDNDSPPKLPCQRMRLRKRNDPRTVATKRCLDRFDL